MTTPKLRRRVRLRGSLRSKVANIEEIRDTPREKGEDDADGGLDDGAVRGGRRDVCEKSDNDWLFTTLHLS